MTNDQRMETMMAKAKKSKGKARMTPSRTQRKAPAAARRPRRKAAAEARRSTKNAPSARQPRSSVAVARRRRASIAVAGDDPVFALQPLLENLRATRAKLQSVQVKLLNDEDFREFSRQSNTLDSAINRVGNANLEVISAKLKAELPAITKGTEQLQRDLQRLKDSVEIIKAFGSALGIIENIAKLFA